MTTSMWTSATFRIGTGLAVCMSAALLGGAHVQPSRPAIPIDPDDIGGVVTSARGPEAGVWVIAETTDLPTKFVRIVVTDDQGRYVLPDLPKASYTVWARGYGLVDWPKGAGRARHDAQPRRRRRADCRAQRRSTTRPATGSR